MHDRPYTTACVARLMTIILLFVVLSAVPALSSAADGYVVLIDCGSSGSRVHVHSYQLPPPQQQPHRLPIIAPSLSLKVKPGLTAFTNITAAADSLRPLIDFAVAHVPVSAQQTTPIFVYATAGLRTVDDIIAIAILKACEDVVTQSPFRLADVRVLSGVEEGIAGWIATNYLLNAFDDPQHNKTVGVLEMGGASFQLTYAPVNRSAFPASALHLVTVGMQTFDVYTSSHLNYGLEKAQEIYHTHHDHIINSKQANPCYPRRLHKRAHAAGDYEMCVALVDQIIRSNLPSASADCSMDAASCWFGGHRIPQIEAHQKFIAIENFYYTLEFFDLHHNTGNFIQQLKQRGREFCALNWDDIHRAYPNEPISDLEKYCFSAAYLPRVLELALNLTSESILESESIDDKVTMPLTMETGGGRNLSSIHITKHIDGVPIDWALGAVLLRIMQRTDERTLTRDEL